MNDISKIIITERQLLHIFIDHPDYIDQDIIVFITDIANDFYTIFHNLITEKFELLPEHIFKNKTENIDIEHYNSILNTEYQIDKYKDYVKEINDYNLLNTLETKILKETLYELKKSGNDNLDTLKKCYNEFGSILDQLENKKEEEEKEYLTFYDLVEEHKEVITERSQQIRQTSGCPTFDELLPQVIPGLIVLAGYSGSCKSTFSHYLQKQRIIKRLPTIAINTELSKIGYNDGMLPSFLKVDYYDLLGINKEDKDIDYDLILSRFTEIENRYKGKNNFLYLNKYSASINDLESFVQYSRETMKLNKNRTLFCFIDLLSMLAEFNKGESGFNKADTIEKNVNRINEFCLNNNVLCLGTLQLKRKDEKKKIERLEDIEKYKPNASDIKSSGAWEERARMVLSIHNPWSIIHRNPCNQIIRDTIDPIVYITINKDNYFQQTAKEARYLYQENYKTFVPYKEIENT
jgi:hypothetical protein